MARPFKSGVDYFPLDVKMDDEIELIESEHGIIGFGVLIKLYQKVYANNYWLKWDNKEVIVFSKRINVDKIEVIAIINTCLEWGIFSKELFDEYSILTSRGIQKRFFEITNRRKIVNVVKEFLLLDFAENKEINMVYVDINSIDVYINSINDDRSTQSKGKGKGKESKVERKKSKTKKVFDDYSTEMKICKYFFAVLRKSIPEQNEPNWQNWCNDIDLFIRKMKPTNEEIKTVINYAHDPENATDKFSWIPNIRSPKKLRQHFETILLQSKTPKKLSIEEHNDKFWRDLESNRESGTTLVEHLMSNLQDETDEFPID